MVCSIYENCINKMVTNAKRQMLHMPQKIQQSNRKSEQGCSAFLQQQKGAARSQAKLKQNLLHLQTSFGWKREIAFNKLEIDRKSLK